MLSFVFKSLTLVLLPFSFLLMATSVYAESVNEWSEKYVAIVVEQIKSEKGFLELKEYPNTEIVIIQAAVRYYIDVKAKLCFAGNNLTLIPCKALKDGYPLLSPIISWEK
jgi:hypothetical protein